MAESKGLKCSFTDAPIEKLGSLDDVRRGKADGVSTNVGVIHKSLVGVYEHAAGSVLSADPKEQRDQTRARLEELFSAKEMAA